MDIIDSLKWRYATKKFDNKKIIPQDKIDRIKEAFNLTATSYGMQPIKLLIIQNKSLQEELVEHSFNQQQVALASHLLIFCISDITQETIVEYFDRVKAIRDTPDDILSPFKDYLLDNFSKKDREEIRVYCKNQAYLAMGNLLTVCAVEGIDACPMEGFNPDAYDEKLNLKEKGLNSVLVMPIGYRAEDDFFSSLKKVRKTVAESTMEL
jgi:nitroreductase